MRGGGGWACAAVAALVLVSCRPADPGTDRAPDGGADVPVAVRVTQYSHDQVNEVLAVNVANTSDDSVTVESLDVRAPGFEGPGRREFGASLGPGRAYDLRVPVGDPLCDEEPEGGVVVLVELAGRAAPLELAPADGASLLRRLRDDQCAIRAARAAVPMEWTGSFPVWAERAVGTLMIGPVSETAGAELVEIVGTTLLNAEADSLPLTVRSGDRARVQVAVRPARCDAHGIGEGPESFHFLVRMRLRDGLETLVPVVVGTAGQRQLLRYVLDACDLG